MREPKQLIEECKKHLRDTEQYKHEYKKDIRKLITALEKQLIIANVSNRRELLIDLLDKLEKGGGNRFVSKEWIVNNHLQGN